MWLDAPELTNHTLSEAKVLVRLCADIECALCLIIVRICGIVRELSASRSRLSFLLSALLFVVAKFSTLPAFDWVDLATWSGSMAPPSAEHPWCVPSLLPMVRVVLSGWLTMSTSSETTIVSSIESSSLFWLEVEHLTVWRIASWSVRPTISIEGWKMREDSPLQGWHIWLCQIVVLSQRGVFAPFFHRRC